jgi:predicted nuclease of restriction endonuclease-like RecB superfamily
MPKKPALDDNTEKELIELLEKVLGTFFKDLEERLRAIEHKQDKIMTALETLTNSVNANTQGQANLTTAVNAAIVQLGTPGATEAQLLSLATAIDQNTQSDKALTDALIAAVNPTPTP